MLNRWLSAYLELYLAHLVGFGKEASVLSLLDRFIDTHTNLASKVGLALRAKGAKTDVAKSVYGQEIVQFYGKIRFRVNYRSESAHGGPYVNKRVRLHARS